MGDPNISDTLQWNNNRTEREVQRGEVGGGGCQDQTERKSSPTLRAALFFFMYLPDVEDIQSRAETVKALPDSLSCHRVTR